MQSFLAVEIMSHFALSLLVILIEFPLACPAVFLLVPVAYLIQRLGSTSF
jgi:hypothetical protein